MAAKRITQTNINWAALAERVPEHQKPQFIAFKSKSDQYLRRVFQYPEQSPKINWALYKKTLPKPALVDEFEKQFNALQIPYPPDTLGGQLDTLENEIKSDVAKYKTESNARIDEYKKQLAHLAALISYDQMTMEDVRDALPDIAVDSLNKPTFWPHTPEEQLDYKDKEEPSAH